MKWTIEIITKITDTGIERVIIHDHSTNAILIKILKDTIEHLESKSDTPIVEWRCHECGNEDPNKCTRAACIHRPNQTSTF